jgi:acetyl-CoA carboxylase carboxyltransferase component
MTGRFSYEIRDVIEIVADLDSFIELKKGLWEKLGYWAY